MLLGSAKEAVSYGADTFMFYRAYCAIAPQSGAHIHQDADHQWM